MWWRVREGGGKTLHRDGVERGDGEGGGGWERVEEVEEKGGKGGAVGEVGGGWGGGVGEGGGRGRRTYESLTNKQSAEHDEK